jgi:hypothetical protein
MIQVGGYINQGRGERVDFESGVPATISMIDCDKGNMRGIWETYLNKELLSVEQFDMNDEAIGQGARPVSVDDRVFQGRTEQEWELEHE